ncbi:hypothetical protein EJB05_49076, partial [Eragrostis curvula]
MLQQPPLPAPMGPDAVEEPASPPPLPLSPAHARTAVAAKALMYLCLWSASFGAATVVQALSIPGCQEGCDVNDALLMASMAAFLFTVLFALAAWLLVKRAGLIVEFTEVSGPPSGSFRQDTAPLLAGTLAVLAFWLGDCSACLIVITCFVFLPFTAMHMWRMKLGGNTVAGSI